MKVEAVDAEQLSKWRRGSGNRVIQNRKMRGKAQAGESQNHEEVCDCLKDVNI